MRKFSGVSEVAGTHLEIDWAEEDGWRGMFRDLSVFYNKDGVDEKLEEVQIMMESVVAVQT